MKTNASNPQVLRSLAATMLAFLAASCEKPPGPISEAENPNSRGRTEVRKSEIRESEIKAPGYHWNAGDSSSYKLELSYRVGNAAEGVSPDPAVKGVVIRACYHVAALNTDGRSVTLAVAMSGTEVHQDGRRSPVFENLANTTPAVLTVSADGAIQQILFPGDVPQGDRQFLRTIYGIEFQMKGGAASWTASEAGPTPDCSFQSTYAAGNKGTVIKTRSAVPGTAGVEVKTLKSSFIGKVGPCWLESLSGSETLAISSGGNPIGDIQMDLSLERSRSTGLTEIASRLLTSAPKPGEFTMEPTAAADRRVSASEQIRIESIRAKFANVPYEVPFEALAKVSDTGSLEDSLPALYDFRDMLIIRPEFAPLVAETLKTAISPRLSSLLAHSLELANTEATQKTLADILANPGDYSATALSQAIVAAGGLGKLKVPAVAEALDIIQSSFDRNQDEYPLGDAALFSLSRLAPANPELRQPLADVLAPLLSGSNEESRCTAVLALANAKLFEADLIGLAQNLLFSPETQTRTAALSYFEGATDLGPEQIQSIAGLLKDSQEPVQLQAISTLAAATRHGNRQGFEALNGFANDASVNSEVREAARLAIESASATAGK